MNKYIHGVNSSTYDLLFSDLDNGLRESTQCSKAFLAIKKFTENGKLKLQDDAFSDEITKDVFGRFQYKDKDFVVCFHKLTDFFPTEFLGEKIIHPNSRNKSYAKTVNMALFLPSCEVLTGYVNFLGNEVIHSVIQLKSGNSIIILDEYLNVLMFKEAYLKLTNFRSISKINNDELISDRNKKIVSMIDLSSEAYLFFRDEIVCDIGKNKMLLKTI